MVALSASNSAHAQYVGDNDRLRVTQASTNSVAETNQAAKNPKAKLISTRDAAAQTQQDATVIQGVNTAGTVRVNNLAMLEALLNIGAGTTEIIGVAWGSVLLAMAFIKVPKEKRAQTIIFALALISFGISTPGILNYLLSTARNANMFS